MGNDKLEKQRIAQKRWREQNPDKNREANKNQQANRNAYYWRNRDRIRASRKSYEEQYYKEHKEEILRKSREHYRVNRSNELLRRAKRKAKIKYEVLTHYSVSSIPQCAYCGIKDIDVLCIDHIDNDGYKRPRNDPSRKDLCFWLYRHGFPEGYQVLCANCNLKKQIQLVRSSHHEAN